MNSLGSQVNISMDDLVQLDWEAMSPIDFAMHTGCQVQLLANPGMVFAAMHFVQAVHKVCRQVILEAAAMQIGMALGQPAFMHTEQSGPGDIPVYAGHVMAAAVAEAAIKHLAVELLAVPEETAQKWSLG